MTTTPHLIDVAERPDLDESVLLVDVGSPERFLQAHLPGAVLVTPAELVDGRPPVPGRLPAPERLAELAARLELDRERALVVYDDEGGGWAGRLIWTLEVLGHRSWRYLDGGLVAWHGAGLPLEQGPAAQTTVEARDLGRSLDRAGVADLDDVLEALERDDTLIWDARSAEEYRGERSGSARAGHIPGAVHLDWTELMDPGRDLRLRGDLETLLASRGITRERRIITHCQSHHRSGLSWLVARLLEHPQPRAYHGSWAEWGNHPHTPIHTGEDP